MSLCKYCGKKAGWFKDAHEACIQKSQRGVDALKAAVTDAVVHGKRYEQLKDAFSGLITEHAIPQEQAIAAIKDGWSAGASQMGIQQPLNPDECDLMSGLYLGAGLTQEEMRKTQGWKDMVFSFVVWTVLHDKIDPYQGPLQFNLQAGEVPVFGIANVLVSENRTTTSYAGGYAGASVKVASGLWYHLGGVRGHRVESTSIQEIDYGDFLITTKGIYFGGTERGNNFRVPFDQILRFQPYSDAIGICKNHGKEQIFAPQQLANTGWFLFNILQALASKAANARSM